MQIRELDIEQITIDLNKELSYELEENGVLYDENTYEEIQINSIEATHIVADHRMVEISIIGYATDEDYEDFELEGMILVPVDQLEQIQEFEGRLHKIVWLNGYGEARDYEWVQQ